MASFIQYFCLDKLKIVICSYLGTYKLHVDPKHSDVYIQGGQHNQLSSNHMNLPRFHIYIHSLLFSQLTVLVLLWYLILPIDFFQIVLLENLNYITCSAIFSVAVIYFFVKSLRTLFWITTIIEVKDDFEIRHWIWRAKPWTNIKK